MGISHLGGRAGQGGQSRRLLLYSESDDWCLMYAVLRRWGPWKTLEQSVMSPVPSTHLHCCQGHKPFSCCSWH